MKNPSGTDVPSTPKIYSLKRRLTAGLLCYVILLTLGVLANDFIVNESAERLAWESLLSAELTHFIGQRQRYPDYIWPETETLQVLEINDEDASDHPLWKLSQGVHDEIVIDGREKVILIQDVDGQRFVIALDIADLEGREAQLRHIILLSAFIVVALLSWLAAWAAGRLIQPLQELAERIGALNPAQTNQSITLPANATSELALIAQSVNRYIERNAAFLERGQSFVRIASHELRTPIAVITSTTQLALNEPSISEGVRKQLLRIAETANDTNELVTLLLTLAKDPEQLINSSEAVKLHQLLPQLVCDHQHLALRKEISIIVGEMPECTILAPAPLVKSAIGNLLRNAIEHTYGGDVLIYLREPGIVVIQDHGPGLSHDKVAEIYTQLARGDGLHGGGIGLALISRLCQHLDWSLSINSTLDNGTQVALSLFPSEIECSAS